MASVYAATHRNGTRAAVKLLHPELSVSALSRQRFLTEGRAANAVGHPGAVRILDDDVADDGSLYLVTELLEGETLEQRRARFGGRLPEREVLVAIDQVLDVLVAAHAQGVVHRDLKPENLFLTRSGQIKVLDFGIARLREPAHASRLTQVGDSMGTPAFMSPEHARGLWDEVDARSDLWSLGASMFQLLSGALVHEGRTVNEQLLAAMTRPAAALSTVAPAVHPALRRLVDRAVSFDKRGRFPDAVSMRSALRAAYQELYGVSIDTAPKLSAGVPSPDRSLVRLRAGGRASAERTVSLPARGALARLVSWRADNPRAALSVAALVVAVVVSTLVFGFGGASAPVASTFEEAAVVSVSARPVVLAPPHSPGPPSPESSAAPGAPAAPPEMAATDLPVARPVPSEAPPPAPRPPPPAPKKDCDPPYVVESGTGKKLWKMECL